MVSWTFSALISFQNGYNLQIKDKPFTIEKHPFKIKIDQHPSENAWRLDLTYENDIEDRDLVINNARNEISKIVNLISWSQNIPIRNWRITSIVITRGNNKSVEIINQRIIVFDNIILAKPLGSSSLESLRQTIMGNYNEEITEILSMYTEAQSETSKPLKFLLFYRILEKLHGNRKGADNYIINWHNNRNKPIEMKASRGQVTIFTFLRDNIHPKDESRYFPYNEITRYLPTLTEIARQSIAEKYEELANI